MGHRRPECSILMPSDLERYEKEQSPLLPINSLYFKEEPGQELINLRVENVGMMPRERINWGGTGLVEWSQVSNDQAPGRSSYTGSIKARPHAYRIPPAELVNHCLSRPLRA